MKFQLDQNDDNIKDRKKHVNKNSGENKRKSTYLPETRNGEKRVKKPRHLPRPGSTLTPNEATISNAQRRIDLKVN
jgi:hypothetical protein